MVRCGETLFEEGGTCETPMRLSMYDGAIETVDYMWVNIWCMLHAKLDCWILSQSCRNTSPRENTLSSIGVSNPGFRGGSSLSQPPCCRLFFPGAAQDIFVYPITPWDSAESIYMVPTMRSCPSFFLRSLAIQFPPWPETHFNCLWLNKKAVPRPCYHLTIT